MQALFFKKIVLFSTTHIVINKNFKKRMKPSNSHAHKAKIFFMKNDKSIKLAKKFSIMNAFVMKKQKNISVVFETPIFVWKKFFPQFEKKLMQRIRMKLATFIMCLTLCSRLKQKFYEFHSLSLLSKMKNKKTILKSASTKNRRVFSHYSMLKTFWIKTKLSKI